MRPGTSLAATPAAAPRAGRVLLVGPAAACETVARRLVGKGYVCGAAATLEGLREAAIELRPQAILLVGAVEAPEKLLALLREDPEFRGLPVLADVSGDGKALRKLEVDDCITTRASLVSRIEAALQAKRLVQRDAERARRMESLLEITQAATSSLELEDILGIAVEKLSRVLVTDRCSVVLVEGSSPRPRVASVVASAERPDVLPLQLDLAKYPELRRSLETRQSTYVEDASRDPLMQEVRGSIDHLGRMSVFVLPLISQDDLLGALFLRLSRTEGAFDREDQDYARAVAAAIANSVRNSRLHSALKRKREDLESAYVDRYRELSEANRRLKELNRFKDELIAVCSHDLRAPLQVLLGHARLLLDSNLSTEQTQSADAVVRQSKKMLTLVESLLEQGRGEQTRVALDASMLDLAQLCHEATSELGILAKERRIQFVTLGADRLPAIADLPKLREVMQNLLTNALAHAPDEGRVTVSFERQVRPDSEVAKITVHNDGPSIPEDQLHLVFDRYRHGPGGTGLGLAICKEFVELHGGEIWAESPKTGGASFVLTLPLARGGGPPLRAPVPGEAEARVLIVEDEPSIAAVLEEILRSRYRVELARDGAEGLAKARALQPDLIVMDVFLPRMDGLDAAVALKASSDTANIPVILLSAHQGVADKVKAMNLGAVDYLAKPFQALELLRRTERALSLRRTERELAHSLHLLKQTGRDAETGCHDRIGIVARIEQEASRSRRYARPLTLARLELRGATPEQRRKFASDLRALLRAPDVISHLGDGVFVVMLPECAQAGAERVFARLLPDLEEPGRPRPRVLCAEVPSQQQAEAVLDGLLQRS